MNSIREIQITVDGCTETIFGESRSENIYYCLESPVFSELPIYGCEIEVEENDGRLKFVRVVKESDFTLYKYLWSSEFLESEKGKKIKQTVIEVGGTWEQVMGGLFYIYLPREMDKLIEEILMIAE